MQHKYRAITICFLATCLLLAGLILFESQYKGAISSLSDWSLSRWSFSEASAQLQTVPAFYRDARLLKQYVRAGEQFYAEEYTQARAAFLELGEYRDSAAFLEECDYRHALQLAQQDLHAEARPIFQSLSGYRDSAEQLLHCDYKIGQAQLSAGQLEEARETFASLSQLGYENADTMLQEVNYRFALQYSADEYFDAALVLLRSLGDYSDSNTLLSQLEHMLYTRAEQYLSGDLQDEPDSRMTALYLFALIPDYKQASQYVAFIDLLELEWAYPIATDDTALRAGRKECYERFLAMWTESFPAAGKYIASYYPDEFLEGRWKGDGRSLRVTVRKDNSLTDYVHNLPGAKTAALKIEDNTFFFGNSGDDGWTAMYLYNAPDPNTLEIYVLNTEQTYTLKRQ